MVNWDGNGLRKLVDGFASDVWRDPRTGIEWLYVRSGDGAQKNPIIRYRMDDLTTKEVVWKRTPTGHKLVTWFQLSADGKRAGDAFPFGNCGVASLETGNWKKYGSGCWPSLAPDDSYRLFYFLGNHYEILLFDKGGGNPRKVKVNGMPDKGADKVYYPRWSNNARFLTVIAPERSQESDLFIGRFDEEFTQIESWARVTHDSKADHFGDAWIATSQ
jgi:hypothetical protein